MDSAEVLLGLLALVPHLEIAAVNTVIVARPLTTVPLDANLSSEFAVVILSHPSVSRLRLPLPLLHLHLRLPAQSQPMDSAAVLLVRYALVLYLDLAAANTAIAVRPLTTVVLDASLLLEFVEIHWHSPVGGKIHKYSLGAKCA